MTKKTDRAEALQRHYDRLEQLYSICGDDRKYMIGKKLFTTLLKLEKIAHKAATDYCNGDIQSELYDAIADNTKLSVYKLLPNVKGLKINGDPRGYALKIDDEVMREYNYPLDRDMGGYGILSPDIS